MASATPAAAIEARLRAQWTSTPVFLPNEVNEGPRDSDGNPLSFVVIEFPGGSAEQISIGAPGDNVWREIGAFMIHVMVPVGEGAAAARSKAATIASIFRGKEFDGVECWAPLPPQESQRADGVWWGCSFGTPYLFDLRA